MKDDSSDARLRQNAQKAKASSSWSVLRCCFTNYGMLTGNLSGYIFRLMSQMEDLPWSALRCIWRCQIRMWAVRNQESPFRYFLEQPPLRWALYLTVLTILIFMLFTARRRQRVIPVVEKPKNKSFGVCPAYRHTLLSSSRQHRFGT